MGKVVGKAMSYYQDFSEYHGSVGAGFAITIGLNLLQGVLLGLIVFIFVRSNDARESALVAGLFGWGVIQLLYVVPICLYLRRTKMSETAKGMLIAAAVVLLLNATCWGLLGFRR